MRHGEAEAERHRLQPDDHEHTYFTRKQRSGEWEIMRANIPRPTSHRCVAGRVRASSTTDAEQHCGGCSVTWPN
jgi:hypothetical protein